MAIHVAVYGYMRRGSPRGRDLDASQIPKMGSAPAPGLCFRCVADPENGLAGTPRGQAGLDLKRREAGDSLVLARVFDGFVRLGGRGAKL